MTRYFLLTFREDEEAAAALKQEHYFGTILNFFFNLPDVAKGQNEKPLFAKNKVVGRFLGAYEDEKTMPCRFEQGECPVVVCEDDRWYLSHMHGADVVYMMNDFKDHSQNYRPDYTSTTDYGLLGAMRSLRFLDTNTNGVSVPPRPNPSF